MRKGPYFVIQAVLSLFITTMIWYMDMNFLDVAVNDETVTGATFSPFIVLLIGGAFYLALTIVYIIIGAKRMDDWRPWMIAINIVIHIVMFGLGLFAATIFAAFSMVNGGPQLLQYTEPSDKALSLIGLITMV